LLLLFEFPAFPTVVSDLGRTTILSLAAQSMTLSLLTAITTPIFVVFSYYPCSNISFFLLFFPSLATLSPIDEPEDCFFTAGFDNDDDITY